MRAGYKRNEGFAVYAVALITFLIIATFFVIFILKPMADAFFSSPQYELLVSWSWLPEVPALFR